MVTPPREMRAVPWYPHSLCTLLMTVLFLLLCRGHVRADERISSAVVPSAGTTDDTFLFTVRIPKDLGGGYPVLTGGEGFSITLRGPREVDSGSATVYEYQLIPRGVGVLETPGVQVDVRTGSRVELRPITVQVVQGTQKRGGSGVADLILQQTSTKTTVFLGEQLSAPVELLAAVPIFDASLPLDTPPGFIGEPAQQEERDRRFIDGREFSVLRHHRTLFPTSTGEQRIPAVTLSAKMRVLRSQSSPFIGGMIRSYSLEEVTVRSNELKLTVLPLPEPPPGIARSTDVIPVGQSSIRLRGSFNEGMVGIARELVVEISSEGNLRPLSPKLYASVSGARVYVEGDQIVPIAQQGRIIFKRTLRFSLVPTAAGLLNVPPIELTWFDPTRREYQKARVEGFTASIALNPRIPVPSPPPVRADSSHSVSAPQETAVTEPLLRFEDPTVFERLVEEYGATKLGFYAISAVALVGAIFAVLLAAKRARPSTLLARAIEEDLDLSTYQRVLQQLLGVEQNSPDSLRYVVERIASDPAERLLLYELIDDLFSPLPPTPSQQRRISRNLKTVLQIRSAATPTKNTGLVERVR